MLVSPPFDEAKMLWYIVLAPFQSRGFRRHLGLGGDAWPLDPENGLAKGVTDHRWAPISVAGCSFDVCIDEAYASSYFEEASAYIPRLRLIEVGRSDEVLSPCSGFDIGRPSGGFSAAGEICASARLFARYGRFLNDEGLFGSLNLFEEYMKARDGREVEDGLEYLDESLAVSVRILRVAD